MDGSSWSRGSQLPLLSVCGEGYRSGIQWLLSVHRIDRIPCTACALGSHTPLWLVSYRFLLPYHQGDREIDCPNQGIWGRYTGITGMTWDGPSAPGCEVSLVITLRLCPWTPSSFPARGLCTHPVLCLEAPSLLPSHLALCWPSGLGFNLFSWGGPCGPLSGSDLPIILSRLHAHFLHSTDHSVWL